MLPFLISAQDIPVGTWRTHFSYLNAKLIEKTADKVFCAAENGLFSISLADGEVRRLSKIDGLSDVGASAMKYDNQLNTLVIGYASGLIDVISEEGIAVVTEVFNSSLEGDKRINDIGFSPGRTYVATDLGIVVLNTQQAVIQEIYIQIGVGGQEVEVKEVKLLGNDIYARTNEGVQRGDLSTNLLDFNNWEHYPSTQDLSNLETVGEQLYALQGTNLFQLINNVWTDTSIGLPVGASRIFESEGNLYTASSDSIYLLENVAFGPVRSIAATFVNDLELVGSSFWIGDHENGLSTDAGEQLSPDGPYQDEYSRIKVLNERTYGFHAPDPASYTGNEEVPGYSIFENGSWTVEVIADFSNVSDMAMLGTARYFSSVGKGLFDEATQEIITDIPQSIPAPDTVITSLTNSEGLWITSYANQHPLHRFDGSAWESFSSTETISNQFLTNSASQSGILWLTATTGGVVNFDSEQGRSQLLSSANGIPGTVLDVEISVQDNAWVATNNGPVVFPDASFVFEFNEAVIPTFENQPLFENEEISSIVTDGGNRVWFGTNRGLWLFDGTISERLATFTAENSPLPSDEILDLAYNGKNGEVFIATSNGMVSFRSASSIGSSTHQSIAIFPNPVLPEYTGLVGFSGLARDVSIKITDINGSLVQEIDANGGAASWDLRNQLNNEVVTGIYLIFSATADGEETYVGKLAIVR